MNITQHQAKRLFAYNPESGDLVNRVARGRAKAGDDATFSSSHGYRQVSLGNKKIYAHRLIWLYCHGELPADTIDHINRDRADNRLENLRSISHRENNLNKGVFSHNTSGRTGVSWCKQTSKWSASIKVNQKSKRLGRYVSFFDACCARASAEVFYGFVCPDRRAD